MNRKRWIGILLLVLCAYLLSSCVGTISANYCCPTVVGVSAQDPWVCPGNCPGGGKTRINYEVTFKDQNQESCDPTGTFTISVRNLTDGKDLPPLTFTSPPVFSKKGTYDVTLTKDTEFEISAKLDDAACGTVKGKQKINVVDPGDYHTVCSQGPLDYPKCSYSQTYIPFGSGVLIQYVKNDSKQGANATMGTVVTKDGKTITIQPYGSTDIFARSPASGLWTLGLDAPSCKVFSSLSSSKQVVCVDVYLMCSCTK